MKKWLLGGLTTLLVVATVAAGAAWWALRGSLPVLDGEVVSSVGGPRADVRLERDADGVVTAAGEDPFDVAYAIGYAHGQDRYFQMDLSRRLAAGELAALLGEPLVVQDQRARIFRLREVARRVIAEAGYGEYFIHRTGHGIGMEAHEDPYMVEGNDLPLAAGHAFSVEPGIYVAGKWGMRLEDIVVATADGPLPMNTADHGLAVVG